MAEHNVTLQAVYDDAARTVTITGMAPPPPAPSGFDGMWFGQTGPGFEVVLDVQPKSITAAPTAIYIVPGSQPVERRLVEYRDGAWQMPGTVWTED